MSSNVGAIINLLIEQLCELGIGLNQGLYDEIEHQGEYKTCRNGPGKGIERIFHSYLLHVSAIDPGKI